MEIIVDELSANQRIDKLVRRVLNNAPLSFIYRMFRQKDVKVNDQRVKIDYITQVGDKVFIYIKDDFLEEFSKPQVVKPVKSNMDILYEDDNLLIVNKPVGLLVHGDEKEKRITLQNIFLNYLIAKGEFDPKNPTKFVPGPAHRLDRNTSGVVVLGKNLPTLQKLLELFRTKEHIEKTYLALLAGNPPKQGMIDYPLIKDGDKGIVKIGHIEKGAKPARTEYVVEKMYGTYSLVRAKLITGRTHQLRVHFKAINCPIVGDGKYGNYNVNKKFEEAFGLRNQMLHASTFEFKDVDGYLAYMSGKKFEAPLPNKEASILESLQYKNI
jgi:23S rRNA pseudouridine955/2504/2580 synthase